MYHMKYYYKYPMTDIIWFPSDIRLTFGYAMI